LFMAANLALWLEQTDLKPVVPVKGGGMRGNTVPPGPGIREVNEYSSHAG
jgi:hypothetical protein